MNLLTAGTLAVLFRMRGGWNSFGLSTFWTRIYLWVLPVFLSTLCVCAALGAYLGLLIPHGKWFARTDYKAALMMALIGFSRALLIVALLGKSFLVLPIALIGALSGLASWYFNNKYHQPNFNVTMGSAVLLDGPVSARELVDGFLFGLCIELTKLIG